MALLIDVGDLGNRGFERAKALYGNNTLWLTIQKYNGSGEEGKFVVVFGGAYLRNKNEKQCIIAE